MKNKKFKSILLLIMGSLFLYSNSHGDEKEKKLLDPHKYNFYTGMFDFSDDGKKSSILGVQHQNENLLRETFLGTLSPITGFMMTADNATYLYTGVQADYSIGKMNFIFLLPFISFYLSI